MNTKALIRAAGDSSEGKSIRIPFLLFWLLRAPGKDASLRVSRKAWRMRETLNGEKQRIVGKRLIVVLVWEKMFGRCARCSYKHFLIGGRSTCVSTANRSSRGKCFSHVAHLFSARKLRSSSKNSQPGFSIYLPPLPARFCAFYFTQPTLSGSCVRKIFSGTKNFPAGKRDARKKYYDDNDWWWNLICTVKEN